MSRIEEGDCDDNESFLRSCAFMANAKRALLGRGGQAVLRELEEALVALPEKKLISGHFADIWVNQEDGKTVYERTDGAVCTMGALLLHRKMKRDYKTRGQALIEAVLEVTCDPDDGGSEAIHQAASALDLVYPLAYELAYQNDEEGPGSETSAERYERVLEWVRSQIWHYSGWHRYRIPTKRRSHDLFEPVVV